MWTTINDRAMPPWSREPRANHEMTPAKFAMPLLVVGGVTTHLLRAPLGSWWLATIPAFMLLSRVTVDEALHSSWIFSDALALYLSGIGYTKALILLAAHAAASVGLSRLREGSVGDTCRRIVLVTGAASGIGRALCEELITEYDDFVIALDVSQTGLDELEAWHREQRHRHAAAAPPPCRLGCIQCDVSELSSVQRAVHRAAVDLREPDESSVTAGGAHNLDDERLPIHAIVHLAGVFACGPLVDEATMAHAERALRVNVLGVMHVTQAFDRLMRSSSRACRGRVVVVGSELGDARVCPALTAPYAMSKLALEGYSAALRQELAVREPPVAVCHVNPGPITTPLSTDATERAALEHVRAKSEWSAGLMRLIEASRAYSRRHAMPAALAAQALGEVVHAIRPPRRTTINYTYAMRIASWTPQWVLDIVTHRMLM